MSTVPRPVITTGDAYETMDLDTMIREIVPDSDVWRVTPNPVFGGRAPNDLIGDPRWEEYLRNRLRAAALGYMA